MEIKIIGEHGCSACMMTKQILDSKKVEYIYSIFSELSDIRQEELLVIAKENGKLSMPLIFINDNQMTLQEALKCT